MHLKWLKKLEIKNTRYRGTLDECMSSYEEQEGKIEKYDKGIEKIAEQSKYHDKVKKMEGLQINYTDIKAEPLSLEERILRKAHRIFTMETLEILTVQR